MITKGQIFATHFPSAPTVGQEVVIHGMKYSWNGIMWEEIGATAILPWTPDYRLYETGSFATYDDAIWRATVATTSIPGTDSTWEKVSMTSAEVLALIASSIESLTSGPLSATSLVTANWTITQIGSDIVFSYNGAKRMKITPAGVVTAFDDVVAFGSV